MLAGEADGASAVEGLGLAKGFAAVAGDADGETIAAVGLLGAWPQATTSRSVAVIASDDRTCLMTL